VCSRGRPRPRGRAVLVIFSNLPPYPPKPRPTPARAPAATQDLLQLALLDFAHEAHGLFDRGCQTLWERPSQNARRPTFCGQPAPARQWGATFAHALRLTTKRVPLCAGVQPRGRDRRLPRWSAILRPLGATGDRGREPSRLGRLAFSKRKPVRKSMS